MTKKISYCFNIENSEFSNTTKYAWTKFMQLGSRALNQGSYTSIYTLELRVCLVAFTMK